MCDRHGVVKTGMERLRCRALPIWWRRWEASTAHSRPGTELHDLLASIGVETSEECACRSRMQQMDAWGVDGCREHRATIIQWLTEAQQEAGWLSTLSVAWRACNQPWMRFADPLGSLVDEAVRRATESLTAK